MVGGSVHLRTPSLLSRSGNNEVARLTRPLDYHGFDEAQRPQIKERTHRKVYVIEQRERGKS